MSVYVLNRDLEVVDIIDDYYSLVWTERYQEAGEFELELPIEYDDSLTIETGYYLTIADSSVIMIIEERHPSTSEEKTVLVLKGQSIESLLKRRVIKTPFDISGAAEGLIYYFIAQNVTNPSDTNRKINIINEVLPTPSLTELYAEQLEPQSIYDICVKICKSLGYGFRLTMDPNSRESGFSFAVYKGVDRSVSQSIVPMVTFSSSFGNVIESSYFHSGKDQVTLVYVITEDLVYPSTEVWSAGVAEPSDLDRWEYVFETTIDRELEEGVVLTDNEVLAIITTRGTEIILENQKHGLFEGDFDIYGNFKYGVDFFMGDIIQVIIGNRSSEARVIELVKTYSVDGILNHITLDYINLLTLPPLGDL